MLRPHQQFPAKRTKGEGASYLPTPPSQEGGVTFHDQKRESSSKEDSLGEHMGQASSRGEPVECDLCPLPTLEPKLESFPRELTPTPDVVGGCDLPPEPSVENYKAWLEW